MRGTISREHPWEVMPDLYFYRDPEEVRRIEFGLLNPLRLSECCELSCVLLFNRLRRRSRLQLRRLL